MIESKNINRENFKKFAQQNGLNENSIYCNHSDFIAWNNIKSETLENDFQKIGDLNDSRYPHYTYNQLNENYWSKDALIALNFYPYQECELYQCDKCKNIFLHYTERGGHGPQLRIRMVRPDLIRDEISCFEFKVKKHEVENLINALNLDQSRFSKILEKYSNLSRVPSNIRKTDVFISEKNYNYINQPQPVDEKVFLVATDKNVIIELIERFNKST
tara:strand:- start:462 stop:1112 length:651 start_codon:yes stop_codon:yes gene_type:complete